MLSLQPTQSKKIVINLRNEYGSVLRLSSYPIVRMVNEYDIKYVDADYALIAEDFSGFVVILVNADIPTTVTIPKSGRSIANGRTVSIGQETEHVVTIAGGEGVTINPVDALALRRDGSFATLIYEGNERWRFVGELP